MCSLRVLLRTLVITCNWVIVLVNSTIAIAQEHQKVPTIIGLSVDAPSPEPIIAWLKEGNSLRIVRSTKDSKSVSILKFDGEFATIETAEFDNDVQLGVEAIVVNMKNIFVVKKKTGGEWLLIDAWRRSDYGNYATVKPIASALQDILCACFVVPFVPVEEVLKSPQFTPVVVGADDESVQLEADVEFRTAWVYPGWKLFFTLDPRYGNRVLTTGMKAEQGGFTRTVTYSELPVQGVNLPSEVLYEQFVRPNQKAKFRLDGSSHKLIKWTGATKIKSLDVSPETYGITQQAIDALVPPKNTESWIRWSAILFFVIVAILCFRLVRRWS